jgi:alpha-D-ribose 1-methylphosphonate 5-triphosphate synthase subunit PhnH
MGGSAASGGAGTLAGVVPGLAAPVHDAQATFRAALDAMAHPGRVVVLPIDLAASPPAPLSAAAAALALTLCDIDTAVWLDTSLAPAAAYLRFHCGCPLVAATRAAHFAFLGDAAALPPLDGFSLGSDEYPDRSTTLVIEVAGLAEGSGHTLSGPGIAGSARLSVAGLPERFWEERGALDILLPRGLDVVLTCGSLLAALPRSVRITR